MKKLSLLMVSAGVVIAAVAFSSEGKKDDHAHDHGSKEESHAHEDEKEHGHEEEDGHAHDEKDEHGHGDEEEHGGASNVGPDKGVTHADEKLGIRLSPEAQKSFDLRFVTVAEQSQIWLPKSAVLRSLEEVNLYRLRDQYLKTIDFQIVSSEENRILVTSKDLKAGDSILVQGVNFVRTAELDAFAGESAGHSH